MSKHYVVEVDGNLSAPRRKFNTLAKALAFIEEKYPSPDPEDNRILIWEVLTTGHRKVVWHFSGWHWNQDCSDVAWKKLPQGSLFGYRKSLYADVMENY